MVDTQVEHLNPLERPIKQLLDQVAQRYARVTGQSNKINGATSLGQLLNEAMQKNK